MVEQFHYELYCILIGGFTIMDYNNLNVKQAGEMVQSFMAISRVLIKFTSQNADGLGLTITTDGNFEYSKYFS